MMPTHESIHLWSFTLSDLLGEVEVYRSLLSKDELERFGKLLKRDAAKKAVLCRGLLRKTLADTLQTDPKTLYFERNENGKPFLRDCDLEFNLSHSQNRLVIAVTIGRAVGVDIEFRRTGIARSAIAERWFSPIERDALEASPCPETLFFDIWSKKEAYVKARGLGIFHHLSSFTVPLGEEGGVPVVTRLAENKLWFFQTLPIDPSYAAAVVSEAPTIPVSIRTH